MPHLFESRSQCSDLASTRQKSRSHLVLFESIDKPRVRQQRQTEHHNALGYLEQSLFASSCHQLLVRGSPESLFCRLPDAAPSPGTSKLSRNESSAIFAVLGIEGPCHSWDERRSSESGASRTDLLETHCQALPQRREPLKHTFNTFTTTIEDSSHNAAPHSQAYASTPIPHHFPQSPSLSNFTMTDETSSQNRILIKGGRCVNDDEIFDSDIFIEDGKIKDIGPHLIVPGGVKTIEARGYYVLPGGIDTHTHLNASFMGCQSSDDFYTGTRAALAGGTTTILDIVIPEKGSSLIEAFKKWRSWADGVSCCDYALRVTVPEFTAGKTDIEMETLVKEHGVNSFKCFMAYKDCLMLRDEDLVKVYQKCRELGALPIVHAENGDIIDFNVKKLKNLGITGPEGHLQSRPEEVEAEATNRAIMLANQVNCPVYIVHVMSRSAADVIAAARSRGCVVFGEPITAGIGTDGSHYFNRCWRHSAAHVLSPPLRPDKQTAEHLVNLLAAGQLQTTGSDHCTFKSELKAVGTNDFSKIPNGVNGIEERLMVLWEKGVKTGKLNVKQFVAATSTNAAKIFNLYPRKGRLAKGSDADILIWGNKAHTIKAETHHSNVDFNIFEGMQVSAVPMVVISNGRVVLDDNGLHITQGTGRYLSCAPFCHHVFGSTLERDRKLYVKVDRDGKAESNSSEAMVLNNTASTLPTQYPSIIQPTVLPCQEANAPQFYKGSTRSGVRNLQDSSFAISGAQIDDDKIGKTGIRVHNPPGGRSSGIW